MNSWEKILQHMERRVNPHSFSTWFRPTRQEGAENGKLVVRVPDRYDLALSKTIRGYDNDLQVIREMHERKPFSLNRLVSLFETEMDGMVTKDKRALRLNGHYIQPRGEQGAGQLPRSRRQVEHDAVRLEPKLGHQSSNNRRSVLGTAALIAIGDRRKALGERM